MYEIIGEFTRKVYSLLTIHYSLKIKGVYKKMKNKLILFWVIVAIVIVSIYVICTKPTKLGLDLVGGSRLVLEAQTS